MKIKIGENEYEDKLEIAFTHGNCHLLVDGNGKPVLIGDIISALNELASLRQRVEELENTIELGVVEFHTKQNSALRDDFYKVVDDLKASGSIVDVWLMDIATTLRKHGYIMTIRRDELKKMNERER